MSIHSALTVSVDNLSDWQLQLLSTPAELERLPQREGSDLWLRPATLAHLAQSDLPLRTELLLLRHTPTGHRVYLTAQSFVFHPEAQVSEAARGRSSRWKFRRRLLAPFSSKVLCLGQLLTSGAHAVEGLEVLPPVTAANLLGAVGDTLLRMRRNYRAILLKDLSLQTSPLTSALLRGKFNSLPVEPVLRMDLTPFSTFADYLQQLSSKYRVRYRRARTKLGNVRCRPLAQVEVTAALPKIFALYKETSRGADFNLTPLTPAYFAWLGEVGIYRGYFDEGDKLIGFTTALENGPVYQAHFLGLQEEHKYSHHLYHNMLFDLLEAAIAGRYQTLDFGRTATEIKSSVGAEVVACASLIRLRSGLLNPLVPYFAPNVFTGREWQLRQPFRQ